MLFRFLKYIHPTHYFAIKRGDGTSVFPIVEELSEEIKNKLTRDESYVDLKSQEYDLSWQAIQKGYIGNAKTYTYFEELPLQDEYYFIKKYFNPVWVLYILFIRLITFKNPFKEITSLFLVKRVKRNTCLTNPIIDTGKWRNYDSSLVKEKPMVSVIIPTLNRYKYLKDVLEDLEKQEYSNFEVIIVDQSYPFHREFYNSFSLKLTVIYQKEQALWKARNTAVQKSKGALYLLFDDDSRIEKDWIENHLKCLDFFKADISSGVSFSTIGDKIPENYSFFRISDQLDTGNVLIKRSVFDKVGMFDRQFERQRMGDGEFGLRSYLAGFLNISNPYAKRQHLKVGSGGLRQMGSWDAFRSKKWFAPRPIPSVLYLFRRYYGNKRSCLALLKSTPPSIIPYRFKKNKKMLLLGIFVSLFLMPIIVIQVFISWRKASKKINQGALIGKLS